MKRLVAAFVSASVCALLMLAELNAQPGKMTTDVRIAGSVYEPAKLEPTAARVKALKLPPGFQIAKFAEISNPRMLAVAPDGTVYVSQREPGTLSMLKDTNGDGVADVQKVVAEKKMMHGLAIHDGKMYLITVKEIFVADIKPDGTLGEMRMIVKDLPDAGQHPNRTLAVGPDNMLYVSVGSTCNACHESSKESATMLRMNLDGTNRKIYASGLRNTIGFGWHPPTRKMFGMDHGIDWLGDNDQMEELNELAEGKKYGWAYVYADGKLNPQDEPPPELGLTNEDWARQSENPVLLYTAHSAPMQMTFYTGSQFPAEYRNDAFVAMRGSWNRTPPSGYEVVRVRFDQTGKATRIEPFLTGFLVKGGSPEGKDAHFARLAGTAMMRDGSLLVSDDTNNVIYRVSYGNSPNMPAIMNREMISMMLPETAAARGAITVRSNSFQTGAPMPDKFSAYYDDISPALEWSGVPQNAKSVVVMMEDPDAANKPVVHWLIANLAPNVTKLPENMMKTDKLAQMGNAMQGANMTGKIGYYGPKPPPKDKPHNYHFQVFALDTMLNLPAGFNRQALLDAMKNHVVAKGELVGTYQRRPDVRDKP